MSMLKRVAKVSKEWVRKGHRKGQNTHNVSATVSIRESEWEDVGEWMWENREVYNGLSVLPYDGGTYKQAPFEDCSKETYEAMLETLSDVDLTKVVEIEDNTDLSGELACAGGACEIK
jgi:ribonucleoside-diphosphate reductase alpha chain